MRKDKFKRYEIKVVALWCYSDDKKWRSVIGYSWGDFNCNRAARYFGRLDCEKLTPGERILSVSEYLFRPNAKRRGNKGQPYTSYKASNYLKKRKKEKASV